MRKFVYLSLAVTILFAAASARATIFGNIRGIVHDPQHRPIANASVALKSSSSDWSQTTQTNQDGEFTFTSVPLGDYEVTATQSGFETAKQTLTVASGTSPVLHFQLAIAAVNQTAVVVGQADVANMDSVTPTTLVDRQDIAQTPGADRTNSMAMITDYVPAAYVTHDMLHMRGGHQVDWLIDGVPIPNTNIATNLGPQIDPKDIDYLEVQRGSYEAEYGDRTMESSTSCPATASSVTTRRNSSPVSEIGIKPTINSISEGTPSASPTTRVLTEIAATTACRPRSGRLFTMPRTALGDLHHSYSTPVPKTNSGWSPRCARIFTRFPLTRIPTRPVIRFTLAPAFAIVKLSPTATLPFHGSIHLIQTCC